MKQVFIEYSKENSMLYITAPQVWNNVLKDILAVYWDRKIKKWRTKATWPNYLRIYNTFKDQVEVESTEEFKEWLMDIYKTRIYPCLTMRTQLEPSFEVDPIVFSGAYPYQIVGEKFLTTAKGAILADDMGSGKTLTSMSAVIEANAFPCLVVTLNSTVYNWKKEIEQYYPGKKCYVVKGTPAKKKKIIEQFKEENGDFLIVNWEALRSLSRLASYGSLSTIKCVECGGVNPAITVAKCQAHEKPLNTIEFKSVIADELHRSKDPTSQQSRALRAATGNAEFMFGLTGTPIANTEEELFTALLWIDPDSYPSRTKFLERYFITRMNFSGFMEVCGIKPTMREEWDQIISPILRRLPKELILPYLPPIVHTTRTLEMKGKQKTAYTQMKKSMIADLDGGRLTVTERLASVSRLLQFASSYAELSTTETIDPNTGEEKINQHVTLTDPSNKIDAFMEDLPDFGDSQIVVFSHSKQLINLLEERIIKDNSKRAKSKNSAEQTEITYGRVTGDENAVARQEYITQFQNGELKLMLATLSAGGTGITLTNADVVVFLSRNFNSIENKQALARVHRIGSEKHSKIMCVDYISEGTIDEAVPVSLSEKAVALENIVQDEKLLKELLV